jgi:hypothetical protein
MANGSGDLTVTPGVDRRSAINPTSNAACDSVSSPTSRAKVSARGGVGAAPSRSEFRAGGERIDQLPLSSTHGAGHAAVANWLMFSRNPPVAALASRI